MRGEVSALKEAREPLRIVCIGASTGGPPALHTLFKALPAGQDVAYLVAQHMPSPFTKAFAERLNKLSALHVSEGTSGAVVKADHAMIAPGGTHMTVERHEGRCVVRIRAVLDKDTYVPSVDQLFESAARVFGRAVVGVVLTGMGSDGSAGVRAIRQAGGTTLAESQDSSVVYGMPREAVETGCIDHVLPLDQVVAVLSRFATTGFLRV